MDTAEKWIPVVGWEGYYEVSDQGRVRLLTQPDRRGRVLRSEPQVEKNYPLVLLTAPGRRRMVRVHALVMEAFVGPRPEGHEVAHNNGDRHDPKLSNLRYATCVENNADKLDHGTLLCGSAAPGSLLTEEQVLCIVGLIDEGFTMQSVADAYGTRLTTINAIHHGRTWGWLTGRTHQPRIRRSRYFVASERAAA